MLTKDDVAGSQVTEFRPDPRRWFVRRVLMFLAWCCLLDGLIAAVVAGVTAANGHGSSFSGSDYLWLSMVVGPVVVLRLYTRLSHPREDFVLTLDDKELRGPELLRWPWQVRQYSFRLDRLDQFRSSQRRWIDRVLGRQSLCSDYGVRVCLLRRTFATGDVRRLLGLLRVRG